MARSALRHRPARGLRDRHRAFLEYCHLGPVPRHDKSGSPGPTRNCPPAQPPGREQPPTARLRQTERAPRRRQDGSSRLTPLTGVSFIRIEPAESPLAIDVDCKPLPWFGQSREYFSLPALPVESPVAKHRTERERHFVARDRLHRTVEPSLHRNFGILNRKLVLASLAALHQSVDDRLRHLCIGHQQGSKVRIQRVVSVSRHIGVRNYLGSHIVVTLKKLFDLALDAR